MTTRNIYQRLNEVMLEVESIQKDQSKRVNGQYTFASHDAVSKALRSPLAKAGIAIVPTVTQLTQDGNRTLAMMQIDFVNIDKPEDFVRVSYPGYGIDAQDKGPGKAMSYAIKYAMMKTFCLDTSDGDDVERDSIPHVAAKKEPSRITLEQVEALARLIKEAKANLDDFCKWMKVTSLVEIETGHYDRACSALRSKIVTLPLPEEKKHASHRA